MPTTSSQSPVSASSIAGPDTINTTSLGRLTQFTQRLQPQPNTNNTWEHKPMIWNKIGHGDSTSGEKNRLKSEKCSFKI